MTGEEDQPELVVEFRGRVECSGVFIGQSLPFHPRIGVGVG
ncbi:hypothetical protein BH11MYX4_BH11MYX4_07140 [soil metagenome]